MTLKEAFNEWAKQPTFSKLAGNYRQDFMSLFADHLTTPVSVFSDRAVIIELIKNGIYKDNSMVLARGLSALRQVMTLANTNGECELPDFGYIRAAIKTTTTATHIQGYVGAKIEKKATDNLTVTKKKAAPKKKRHNTKPHKVVQLDPHTYEPLKTFENAAKAGREVGSKNVLRAIQRRTMCGGYFWVLPGGEKDFKPSMLSTPAKHSHTKLTQKELLLQHADLDIGTAELEQEIEQQREELCQMAEDYRADFLAQFTNDDLLNEIRRRDWKGNVIIPINFEL